MMTNITNALDAKRLVRLHRGVYAVGHAELQPDGHRLAAVFPHDPPNDQ